MLQNNNNAIVWFAKLDQLADAEFVTVCHRWFGEAELPQSNQFRFEQDRRSFLAGQLLTRLQLAEILNVPAGTLRFESDEFGKPFVAHPMENGIQFNRSRTRDMVVSAVVRDCQIGIDVERINQTVEIDSIAEQFFAPAEIEQLMQCTDVARTEMFHRFWTLKEAYVKAHGEGLSIPLDQFAFDLACQSPQISFSPSIDDQPDNWQFVEHVLDDHHRTAIALRTGLQQAPRIEWFDKTQSLIHLLTSPA